MTAATTTERSGQRTTPAAAISKRRQEGARSCLRATAGGDGAKSLPAGSAGARRKPARSVPVPPLEECREDDICRIPIAGGGVAVINAADHHLVARATWHMGGTKRLYPVSKSKVYGGRTTYLHRVIAGAVAGELVDHRDGDQSNARKKNLRKATRSQNAVNRKATTAKSGFCGVYRYPKKRKPWRAGITCEGATYRGPYRADVEAAARDYDALARALFGEFATLNFPEPGEMHCQPAGARTDAPEGRADG